MKVLLILVLVFGFINSVKAEHSTDNVRTRPGPTFKNKKMICTDCIKGDLYTVDWNGTRSQRTEYKVTLKELPHGPYFKKVAKNSPGACLLERQQDPDCQEQLVEKLKFSCRICEGFYYRYTDDSKLFAGYRYFVDFGGEWISEHKFRTKKECTDSYDKELLCK